MSHTPCWICNQPATHILTRKGSNTLHACDHHTRIDRAEAESRGWTLKTIAEAAPAPTHFTAWLVNDTSCLETGACDISVIEDELIGDDPEDETAWASQGEVKFHSVTTVDAKDGDIEEAKREAEALMEAAGWRTVGDWDAVDNAYIVTVERTA